MQTLQERKKAKYAQSDCADYYELNHRAPEDYRSRHGYQGDQHQVFRVPGREDAFLPHHRRPDKRSGVAL